MIRSDLFQRYLFLLLRDVITASHDGWMSNGTLIFIRLNTIVADQPQERALFCLKRAQSYKEHSICLVPLMLLDDRC